MTKQTERALNELTLAHKHMSEALFTLKSISDGEKMSGPCVCGEGRPCAYHADLINQTFDTMKLVDRLLKELRADAADPQRKH